MPTYVNHGIKKNKIIMNSMYVVQNWKPNSTKNLFHLPSKNTNAHYWWLKLQATTLNLALNTPVALLCCSYQKIFGIHNGLKMVLVLKSNEEFTIFPFWPPLLPYYHVVTCDVLQLQLTHQILRKNHFLFKSNLQFF